jgi:hypothetical protein
MNLRMTDINTHRIFKMGWLLIWLESRKIIKPLKPQGVCYITDDATIY